VYRKSVHVNKGRVSKVSTREQRSCIESQYTWTTVVYRKSVHVNNGILP